MFKNHVVVGGAVAALLVLAPPQAASADGPQAQAQPTARPTSQPMAQSMIVVRDAVTGELRPATAAESRALRARDPSLVPDRGIGPLTVRDDGSRKVHLGERRQAYSVLTRDASGKLSMQCVHSEEAANAAVQRPATPRAGEHDHDTH